MRKERALLTPDGGLLPARHQRRSRALARRRPTSPSCKVRERYAIRKRIGQPPLILTASDRDRGSRDSRVLARPTPAVGPADLCAARVRAGLGPEPERDRPWMPSSREGLDLDRATRKTIRSSGTARLPSLRP